MPSSRLARRSRLTRPAQPPIAVAVPLFLCLPSSPAPPPAPPAPSLARSLSLRSLARSSILHGEHTARLAALPSPPPRRPERTHKNTASKQTPRAESPDSRAVFVRGTVHGGVLLELVSRKHPRYRPCPAEPPIPPLNPGKSPPPPPPPRPSRARGATPAHNGLGTAGLTSRAGATGRAGPGPAERPRQQCYPLSPGALGPHVGRRFGASRAGPVAQDAAT